MILLFCALSCVLATKLFSLKLTASLAPPSVIDDGDLADAGSDDGGVERIAISAILQVQSQRQRVYLIVLYIYMIIPQNAFQ